MKREFSFYEFVGVIAPGAVLLIGLQYSLPGLAKSLFKPEFSLGDLGIFIILAYVLGHLIQSVGNLLESLWWKMFGGMPTQWVQKDGCSYLDSSQVDAIPEKFSKLLNTEVREPASYDPKGWFSIVRQTVAALHQRKAADRVEVFNGNYGLFRGIAASLLVTGVALAVCRGCGVWRELLVVLALFLMAIARMHRFGRYYAREIFVQALQLDPDEKSRETTEKEN